MSGLVTGLQNRARRFESARHLNITKKRVCQNRHTLFFIVVRGKAPELELT